jgi:hypothetical protein
LYDASTAIHSSLRMMRRLSGGNELSGPAVWPKLDTLQVVTAGFASILAKAGLGFGGCGVAPQLL